MADRLVPLPPQDVPVVKQLQALLQRCGAYAKELKEAREGMEHFVVDELTLNAERRAEEQRLLRREIKQIQSDRLGGGGLSGLGGVCLPCLPQGRQELVSFEDAKYPCYVMKLSKLIEIGDNFVDRKWAHELLLGRVTTHAHKYVHLPMEMNYATARFWANDFGIPIEANPPDKERSWDVVADAGGDVESALSPKGLSERDTSEESKSSNKESWFSSVCGGKNLKQSTFDGGDGSGDGNDDQERDGTTIVMNYEEFAMEPDFEDGDELEESNAMGAINPMHSDKRFSHPYFVKQEKLKKKKPPKVIDPINDWFEAQWKKLSQPAVPLRKYGMYTGASISQDKTTLGISVANFYLDASTCINDIKRPHRPV